MIRQITICCDWPGCDATLTYDFRFLWPDKPGWKMEKGDSAYSHHLCPKHNRKTWHEVTRAELFHRQWHSLGWN